MRSLGIRAATVLDAERLAAVHAQSWQETYRGLLPDEIIDGKEQRMQDHYATALAEPGATSFWLASWDGEIVALVAASALGPGHERLLELTSLYVLEEYQSRGIEEKLLNHAIGTAPCLVWVVEGALKTMSFYESQGFALDGETMTDEELGGAKLLRMVR